MSEGRDPTRRRHDGAKLRGGGTAQVRGGLAQVREAAYAAGQGANSLVSGHFSGRFWGRFLTY